MKTALWKKVIRCSVALLIAAYGLCLPWSVWAADDLQTLNVVEVTDSQENVVGAADSASEGVVPKKAVEAQVTYEPGENPRNRARSRCDPTQW